MPELPEVETIVRGLRSGTEALPPLTGRRIERATIRWPRHIAEPSPAQFKRRIRGRTIREVSRRGKYLVFELDEGTMLIHLKMSGDLILTPEGADDPYAHTVFHLDNGWELQFSDARKFGRVYLLNDPSEVLGSLGPEPLDKAFTSRVLTQRLRARKRMLKPLLMDQTFLAGLGNIYADEALHRAGIHPLRRSNELADDEIHALWKSIRTSLKTGIRHNGASIDWVYRGGGLQEYFRVYGRTGDPCPECETPIVRIVVGQRSTHFCPVCQPERNNGHR